MSTKTKTIFKKILSGVLSAATVFTGTAMLSTAVLTQSAVAAKAAPAADASTFSWDNATVYFLLTDRFCNGDTSNDSAYGRMKTVAGDNRATFHGGDFAGITKKINEGYFDDLGVTAIWLTAPYEQLNGYILGDNFAHYSYHGYYVTDYTEADKAYGSKEEFRTLVDTAHNHGIRIVMDIVMNHAGYNNMIDMDSYNYGTLLDGWKQTYESGDIANYHSKIDYKSSASDWGRWWGDSWVRSGLPGYHDGEGGSEETQCLTGLPDFRTESTNQVSVPQFLITKWTKEGTLAEKQSKYGTSNTVTGFISSWLAEWVREFGVDGFRCDTAKHVEKGSWKQLKDKCVAALREWKQANPTKKLDDLDFWMTGECWNWKLGPSSPSDPYFTQGGFDSMINFETQGGGMVAQGSVAGTYANYANKINTSDNFNGLSYLSSHDSTLARPSDMYALGSAFLMLPGAVQIYYGDETARDFVQGIPGDGNGGAGHSLRSDMPWDSLNTDLVKHWGIVGNFRKNHVAVGAGANTDLTASSGVGFGRTYSKNGVDDKVAGVIYASANSDVSVDVSSIWSDGTMLTNFYDDSSAVVTGGKVTFNSGAHGTILIQEPDGKRGRVTVTHINQDTGATIKTETLTGLVGDSYTVQTLSMEGFKVAKVNGSQSGTFSETEQQVTIYYSFDSTNYGYIVTKYVDAATGEEIADSETSTAKVGTTYTTSPKDIKNYEVDLTKTTNAAGTVKAGTTTVTYQYTFVEPSNLKVHYYNANSWSSVYLYTYDESGATVKEFTGKWPGKQMTDEGGGWFVCDVPDTESALVIFNNNGGAQEPTGVGSKGYDCSGEVWLKNGKAVSSGKVKVIYTTDDGTILAAQTLTGVADGTTTYTTEEKTFSGYTLTSTPSNATGVFTAETITVTYVYKSNQPAELTNTSTISSTLIQEGSTVTVNGSAKGGSTPYQYAFLYKNSSASSYTTAQAYSSTSSASITLKTAGTYTVLCRVKDNAGTVASKTFSVTVEGGHYDELVNKSAISAATITLGGSVTVTGKAVGGKVPYQYAYYYKKSTSSSYTVAKSYSTATSCKITPSAATNYTVLVKVKDSDGTVASKTFKVVVNNTELTNLSTVSANSITLGNSITVKGAAKGGTSPYQFAYYYRKSTSTSYTTVKSYSSTTSVSVKPGAAVDYVILVKVKDNKSKVVSKTFNVTVTKETPLTNKSTISATSVTLGKSVTLTGKATGGTAPYKFAYFYKKSSADSYTTIKSFSTSTTATLKPSAVGTYSVLVKVMDNKGSVARKEFTLKVVKVTELTNTSKLSASSVTLGSSVYAYCSASGGTSPYQYSVSYKKSASDSYTSVQTYSTNAKVKITPASATTYTVLVKVKDSAGTVKSSTFTLKVTK